MAKLGRPRKIKSPEEFIEKAQVYFDLCQEDGVLPNVTRLALAVGLSGKESLAEYGRRAEFSAPVKAAKALCEVAIIERCAADKMPQSLAIFMLKNHGWTDRQTVEHEGTIRHTGVAEVPKVATAEAWLERYGEHENGQPVEAEVN